ncbi:MAG: helix-turn-helix domain-containing protein [Clostridiales bacterium]|jgi:sugar diacid utilization regulator|nr:helix-turn-helix domain-containing protein [Eubacteriales bacterium]MDH7566074.1 helix-turn-helix domain-containing protein [Clostridiales bacterium]
MDLNFKMLSDRLCRYCPETYISGENLTPIRFVKLFAENMAPFEPDTLYVGKASTLIRPLSLNIRANILCIPDMDVPPECKKSPGLNLMVLAKDVDMLEIFNEIQDILSACLNFTSNSEKLLDTLMHGKGIQHIIDIGYELLGNPIIFGDSSGKLIAHTKYAGTIEPYWDEFVNNGQFSDEAVASLEFRTSLEKTIKNNSPVLIKGVQKYNKISGKVTIDNVIEGYLTVVEAENPFKEGDRELVALLCDVIGAEMQKSKFSRDSRGVLYETLIRSLLDKDVKENDLLDERVNSLGLDLKGNLYILTVNIKHFDKLKYSISYLVSLLENILANSKSVLYGDHIVMLISCSHSNFLDDANLKELKEFFRKNKLVGGLSRCFHDLKDIRYHYRQSLKAIEFGTRSNRKKTLYIYDDYAISHLLHICSNYEDLKEFCHPSLFALMDYDCRNSTSYTQTLYTYLLHNGNQMDSANALQIHRGTLIYRIEKIEAIMNINLDDFNIMHRLYLSFLMLESINKLPF